MTTLLPHAVGWIADLALVVLLLELALLTIYYRRTGRGIAPRDLLGTAAAGFFLVLALRSTLGSALPGARSPGVAAAVMLCLTGSLLAHLYDLRRRWRAPPAADGRALRRAGA